MAEKIDPNRYFSIVEKINAGLDISDEEYIFFVSAQPEIDEDLINRYVEEKRRLKDDPENFIPDPELLKNGALEAIKQIQASPIHREKLAKLFETRAGEKVSSKLADGINMVLGGVDIGISNRQIQASNEMARKSRRPSRPTVPGRDVLLQNALRQAEQGTFDASRAMAPVEAQIQDQYLSDIQGAKTASTGQAGAYGAYRQLASNNRNRAALNLAPIQDEVRRGQQARYDNLLGMRMDETQNMYRNQAYLYPYDLQQYNADQQAVAALGSSGRNSLRNSLYNMGQTAADAYGRAATNRYASLRNKASAAGMNPDLREEVRSKLDGFFETMTGDDTPQYWEQAYMNG